MTTPVVKDFGYAGPGPAQSQKRTIDEFQADHTCKDESYRAVKRTARTLPIRTSPSRPARSGLLNPRGPYVSTDYQIPTPIESSDDECPGLDEDYHSHAQRRGHGDSQASSHSSMSSVKAWPDEDEDWMEVTSQPPDLMSSTYSRQQHRSSDSSLHPLNPALFQPPEQASTDRVPTPIRATFRRDADTDMSGTSYLAPLRTMLSPMIGGDTPSTAHTGLPSPAPDYVEMSPSLGQTSSQMMSGLTLGNSASSSLNLSPTDHSSRTGQHHAMSHGVDGATDSRSSPASLGISKDRNRTARLQMGYRADCGKCQERVHGHYSHILWS